MIEHIVKTTLIGLFFGTFGTTLGGILGVTFRKNSNRFLSFILSLASGLMTSIVCFELIPEALKISDIATVILGIIFGIILMILCDVIVEKKFSNPEKSEFRNSRKNSKKSSKINSKDSRKLSSIRCSQQNSIPSSKQNIIRRCKLNIIRDSKQNSTQRSTFEKNYSSNSLLKTGIIVSIGLAIHNFPEGLAIGSGFEASMSLGYSLAIAIALHDIPEGISMAVPMKNGGVKALKVIFYVLLSGVTTGIGAFFGALIGTISESVISMCLAFAAGAMLYIVSGELIPESNELYKGRLPALGNILGFILGILSIK